MTLSKALGELRKLLITAVVLIVGLILLFGAVITLWAWSIKRPVLWGDKKEVLSACRYLIQNRSSFHDDGTLNDIVTLARGGSLLDTNVPVVIRRLNPSYIVIRTNEVMMCFSALPRVYLLGFPEGDAGYGDDKLIDGLWFSSSPSYHRQKRLEETLHQSRLLSPDFSPVTSPLQPAR